jgi:APA family basic amino acid/polyamine antiporter
VAPQVLRRELGLWGAVMMGLGSIIGTGVFVSIGVAAGIAGPAVVVAIALGALVAACNGLSSAQLAANHPVSGGTYEYGYRVLTPALGFTAGWMFLIAKSASAATAALGFAGYLLALLGAPRSYLVPLALVAVALLTLLVRSGVRRSNTANTLIVAITLVSLIAFVLAGAPRALDQGVTWTAPTGGLRALLHAAALMFVAYTGYGRIATLGEEVRAPRRTIPRAVVVTLLLTMLLYLAVAAVGVAAVGAEALSGTLGTQAAPLAEAARMLDRPQVAQLLSLGAVTAMLGVLLNLILGLSRVLLAMGRRGDMPRALAQLDAKGAPGVAVFVTGAIIALLTLLGDVRLTWSFSAFTVLIYYAITNLAALTLPPQARLFPRWVAGAGLVFCLSLAFFVEPTVWLIGLGLILAGLIWHVTARRAWR